ncbi:MAG: toxic anion resistance protein, partial [Clostridia bacterium]|nr:toxic anion resistance protein [Clostridia bacterium]
MTVVSEPETIELPTAAPTMEAVMDIYTQQAGLTEADLKAVDEFSEKIDLTDSGIILQYGAACQKKIASFSDSAREGVRTKDLGAAGDMIADLMAELKGFSVEEKDGGFLGFFKKAGNEMTRLKARYDKAEVNVNKITEVLEGHQNQLLTDIVMLDKMY